MTSSDLPSLDWKHRGYFGALEREPDSALSPAWAQWLTTLRQAVKGDFAGLPGLVDLARTTNDPVLIQSCYYLLGDAGGAEVAARVRAEAKATEDFEVMLECCHAISARSWLADVPVLLDLYGRYEDEGEASIIKTFISDCVAPRPGELPDPPSDGSELTDFRDAVMTRHHQLVEALGTAQLPVFKAQRFSVRRLAEWIRGQSSRPHFRLGWRRRFEAATGIDCTSFYASGRIQPMAVTALLDAFLASPAAEGYEDGVRYFFGHRLSDDAA